MLKSLRVRLSFILISLAVLPLLTSAFFLTQQSTEYLERQSRTLLRQVAKHVGHEINLFIDANIDQLLLIHRLHGIELISQDNQRTILNNLLYDRQVFQNLALLDANGKELMRLSRSKVFMDNELQNWATREEYLTPATSAKPFFGIIRFDNTIQEPLATISIPILNLRTGDLAYVLLGTLRFKKIWDLLDTIEIPGGACQ